MTDHTLLPCPFCGGEAHLFDGNWVECTKCGCQTPETFEEVAISAWNRRTPPAAVPDGWRDALEHVTELLVDTWHHQMDGDPEEQIAVKDARALLATLPLSVPEGWVLVPKEPTPEMLDAATPPDSDWIGHKWAKTGSIERWRQCHREDAARKYRSMISAAPAAPTEARDE